MRINRLFLAAAVASFLSAHLASAQSKQRLSFGLLLGTNISSISGADEAFIDTSEEGIQKKHRVGLNVGAYFKIPLSGMLSLQPEVRYRQNGVKFEGTGEEVEKIDFSLGYFEVPVLLRLDFGKPTSGLRPLLLAGGSGSYRMQCKLTAEFGGTSLTQNCSPDNGSAVDPFKKKSDYSVIGGVGLGITTHGRSASVQARYTKGLQRIFTTDRPGTQPKNSAISLLLGIGL